MDEIVLNSTLVRKFFHCGTLRKDYCPKQIYRTTIKKDLDFQSLAMKQGALFETLCLGSGIKGKVTEDLPRLRNGERTAAHKRILAQALTFKKLCHDHQIIITKENTQVEITKKLGDGVFLRGTLDIFPVSLLLDEGFVLGILDLKLAKSVSNTWGEYCWGIPENLDTIQGILYYYLIQDVDFDLNPHLDTPLFRKVIRHAKNARFLYWIFEHSSSMRNVFIPIEQDAIAQAEMVETLRKTYKLVQHYNKLGWDKTNSNPTACKNCPLRDSCSDYYFLDTKKGDISAPSH